MALLLYNHAMTRIAHPQLDFSPDLVPVATDFGDIYFSPEDGLAETMLVFLQGNNLPHAWQDKDHFTIAETGFGTGLNFLSTARLFRESRGTCGHLHYISLERFPLSPVQLKACLDRWRSAEPSLAPLIDRLETIYPLRIPGFHTLSFSNDITLTLIFDEAIDALDQLSGTVNAWFLDGFAPSKNPTMWSDTLYQQMASLSADGTTLASFTAAGAVRRGLQDAGFTIERKSGFANKRHRIVGFMEQTDKAPAHIKKPKHVALIGAGLGGAVMAHMLQRHGITCTLYDQHPHSGLNASSNQLGLINPKMDIGHDAVQDMGQSMFSMALHHLKQWGADIDFKQAGSVHLAQDDARITRHQKIMAQSGWLDDHIKFLDSQTLENMIPLPVNASSALYYPDAATVNTGKLVDLLLSDCDVHWVTKIDTINDLNNYDAVIITSAEASMHLIPSLQNIVQPMRGQVTYCNAPAPLPCPVINGHYVAPVNDQTWVTGATFQRQRTDVAPQDSDDQDNLQALAGLIAVDTQSLSTTGQWAHIRYTTPDRRPLYGKIADKLYIATALGSHGLQYSFLLATLMAHHFTGLSSPVAKKTLPLIDVQRYMQKS
jgi:tRNA 5-methylaminomethyl-2-thiouridine biosynthesis bifunctional protein